MKAMRLPMLCITAVLALTQLTACQGPEASQETSGVVGDSRESSGMRVTKDMLARLPSEAHLRLEALAQDDVIVFDPSRGPIDFARIELATGGRQLSMALWLQDAARAQGIEARTLETSELAVKLTMDSAELVSWTRPGPQQQQRCVDCCDTGYCCYAPTCTGTIGGQVVCTCGFVACCSTNPSLQ